MNKLIHHSLLGAFLCAVISCTAFAADSVQVTLNNHHPQWIINRICTTTNIADTDYCTTPTSQDNGKTLNATVNISGDHNALVVRAIVPDKTTYSILMVNADLKPEGSYILDLNEDGSLSLQEPKQ